MTKSKTQSSEHINPNVITLKRINPYSKNKSPKRINPYAKKKSTLTTPITKDKPSNCLVDVLSPPN